MNRSRTWLLNILAFGAFLLIWQLVAVARRPADAGEVSLLPSPAAVAKELWRLFAEEHFLVDVAASLKRIFLGLAVSVIPAFAVGILFGTSPRLYNTVEPLFSFAKYLPPTALIPVLLMWFGVGIGQQLALLFIGTFFLYSVNVAETVRQTPQACLDAARTLGTGRAGLIFRIIIPHGLPSFLEHLRTIVAIAWTYVTAAELVAAERGVGKVIIYAQRFFRTDQMLAGVVAIGILGIASNAALIWVERLLCRWKHAGAPSFAGQVADGVRNFAGRIRSIVRGGSREDTGTC